MSLTTQDLKNIETVLKPKFDAINEQFRQQGALIETVVKRLRQQSSQLEVVDEKFRHQGVMLEAVEAKTDITLGMLSDVLRIDQIDKSNAMRLDIVEANAKTLKALVASHYQQLRQS